VFPKEVSDLENLRWRKSPAPALASAGEASGGRAWRILLTMSSDSVELMKRGFICTTTGYMHNLT